MTAIKDLDLCHYLPLKCDALKAVGWLGRESEWPKGSVSSEFLSKLKELCAEPWEPLVCGGGHACDLCQFDAPWFGSNVFVPSRANIYVAPVGIVHYIAAHWYLPPEEFIQAVLACPPMRSVDYFKALLANGGRALVHLKSA